MNREERTTVDKNGLSEQQFLAAYDIKKYDRPSVTTDIIVFSMFSREAECHRRDAEHDLSVLLIRRGEHPHIGKWALPGGFLRSDETVEECAVRELKEETGITPAAILPVGVFSRPGRDPRGWVISNAYASVVSEEDLSLISGSDAVEAKWFSVDFRSGGEGRHILVLDSGDEKISAELKEQDGIFSNSEFEIVSNSGLAFDHAGIIGVAMNELRKKAENLDIVFDFLPEKFTLASLQRVQETLLGISFLTANFRRKISGLVEETDEYTEGAGHRPARLFKRKDL